MTIAALVVALLTPAFAAAQDVSSARKHFEAGEYEEVVREAAEQRERIESSFALAYLAAQSYQKLDQPDRAREELSRLEQEGDAVWAPIARSAAAFHAGRAEEAVRAAREATERAPDHFYARYQLGLAYSQMEDHAKAAESFERATQIDPAFAYAHYYAGLAYNRIRRTDRMAIHFEYFLKLAPQAPERGAVESVMRTVRGR